MAAVMLATLSTVLLLAPTSFHRLRFREHDKKRLIEISNRLAVWGTAVLALAITCAVYLIGAYVFDVWVGLAAAGLAAVGFASFWYVLPMSRRATDRS